MLGIQINNEWLDLNPGTTMEWEQENPFLQFGNEIIGEFSRPFEVKATPKNMRLLDYAGLLQKRVYNTGIDAAVFDGGLQVATGKIKIEKPTINVNALNAGTISCYFLSGISSFFQDIKDIKLRAVDFGGDRTFPWTNDARSGSNGFWQHIHAVIDAPPGYGASGYDYAFYPVVNAEATYRVVNAGMLNYMVYEAGTPNFHQQTMDHRDANCIVPFPYLKYILQRIMAQIGWNIAGEILDDADFKEITLVNFRCIDWAVYKPIFYVLDGTDAVYRSSVTFDLADHMPDMTIGEFLIALKNRFGWWFDFDRRNKILRIKSLVDVSINSIKDFTAQASPIIPKTVNKDPKIYALKNQFVGEYANGIPDFSGVALQADVDEVSDLPTADEALYGHVHLVRAENNYYICSNNDTSGVWEWRIFAYNVYDYTPDGYNEEITTAATTLGVEFYNAYLDLIPRMDNAIEYGGGRVDEASSWGIHMLFYKGLRNNKAGNPVAYACNHIYDSTGNQVGQWALTFSCKTFAGVEVGLYENWRPVLALLSNPEQIELTLHLNKADYLNLVFSDVITIKNIRLYIKTLKPVLPYNNLITIDGVRI